MERPAHVESNAVSPYWTPQHLDVTDAPLTYAPPKAAWIDGFTRLRPLVRTDADDRLARRRQQTRSIVEPGEIPVLPPLIVRPPSPVAHRRSLLTEMQAMSARIMGRTAR
jgi:hypothetical protein